MPEKTWLGAIGACLKIFYYFCGNFCDSFETSGLSFIQSVSQSPSYDDFEEFPSFLDPIYLPTLVRKMISSS